MSLKVKFEGTMELKKALQKNIESEAVQAIVKQNGAELQRRMQHKAETAFKKGYATGETQRSITLSITDGGMTAKVQPETEYAGYLEYGTRFMEAEPFVKPSFQEQMEQFKKDMGKLV